MKKKTQPETAGSSDGIRSEQRLAEIRQELKTMLEAEVRVLQMLVAERLAEITGTVDGRPR